VWRPRRLGRVIAERKLRFVRWRRPTGIVSVRFGQPVRSPRAQSGDPWWCPVQVTGLAKRSVRPIAGEDSVQALVLTLEFVTNVLPVEAERAHGRLEWLGERERLVFANTLSLGLASRALQNLVEGLAHAVEVLESGDGRRPAAAKQLTSPTDTSRMGQSGRACAPMPSTSPLRPWRELMFWSAGTSSTSSTWHVSTPTTPST
jgi:uncharacterized protein DUF6968